MITIDLASLGAAGITINGYHSSMGAGRTVAPAGDLNGDGIDDFIVSVSSTNSGTGPGGAYVIFGKSGLGPIDLADFSAEDGFFIQAPPGIGQGFDSIDVAGDVNGDGVDDIVIGTPQFTSQTGRAYVIFGRTDGFGTVEVASLDGADGYIITNDDSGQWIGSTVSLAGDINDDGYDDIIIGGHQNHEAYVLFGKADGFGTIAVDDIAPADGFTLTGTGSDWTGFGNTELGDFNGDGIDDFGVTAINKTYVVFGKAQGLTDIDLTNLSAGDGFVIPGPGEEYFTGRHISGAGDVNGDGLQDLLVPRFDGKVYVVFGRAGGAGTIDLDNLGSGGFIIEGSWYFDRFGDTLSAAGDVNGDGYDDILIGAPHDGDGGTKSGGAYVIYGKATPSGTISVATLADGDGFFLQGDAPYDYAGRDIAAAGDVNGDGFDEILVGASANDDLATSGGAAYLVFGVAPTASVTRTGAAGDQTIRGGIGDDTLDGAGGDDRLFGAAGTDTLIGGTGADQMSGGLGNDLYFVDDGGDLVIEGFGEGNDEVRTGLAVHVLAANVETLTGTSATGQQLTGNGEANTITAGAGHDVIDGGAGADSMAGGAGNDVYVVDNMSDVVTELDGGGTDEVQTSVGSKVPPDRLVYALPNFVENLTGTAAGAQGVRDNALNNVINMGAGHDLVVADAGGVDTINGGGGNDFIYFGDKLTAADATNGGSGTDTIGLLGDYGSGLTFTATNLVGVERMALYTSLYLPGTGPNNYHITMNDANVASGTELFVTAASLQSNESLTFNGSAEVGGRFTVHGGAGADTIIGGTSSDFFIGNAGNDSLFGLGGTDFLTGGLGADQLRGGAGADFFRYLATSHSTTGSVDQILDFQHVDRIDLSIIDADGNGGNGNQAFAFIGSGAFTNVAGQLRATNVGNVWTVEGDVNGDGSADLVIQVTVPDATPLVQGDFVL